MHTFYKFWVAFCAGWGYPIATLPFADQPSLATVICSLPLGLVTFTALLLWRVRSELLHRPTFALKPWAGPVGMFLFSGVTISASALWGLMFKLLLNLGEFRTSIVFLAMGVSMLLSPFLAARVCPTRFTV